jgi:hypothetical protein
MNELRELRKISGSKMVSVWVRNLGGKYFRWGVRLGDEIDDKIAMSMGMGMSEGEVWLLSVDGMREDSVVLCCTWHVVEMV